MSQNSNPGVGVESYFVRVIATTEKDFESLQSRDLDLFWQTGSRIETARGRGFAVDGLLGMDDVEQLVKQGYQVEVQDPAEKRYFDGVVEFPAWFARLKPVLKQQRQTR